MLDHIGGDDIEADLANQRLGRRHRNAVNGDIGQAGFSTAHLNVFTLAFQALERHGGEAADGVGDVGIGQADDDFRRQDLLDVVCRA